MRIFLLALSALNLLWVHPLYAQTVNNSASLSIPMDNDLDSARSAVLGPAYVAVADDGAALFWNPAGLGQLSSGELSLHYQDWISQTSLDTLLVALPMPGWGGVGLAAHYMDYGTFAGRDASGTPTASFSADRIALEGGWGYPLDETLSIGLGTRASQQNLAGNNYTDLSFDGGLLYRASTELTLALAFSGLGESGAQGDLPFTLNMGVAYRPELSRDWALLLCGAGSIEQANLTGLQTGAEAVYQGHYALRAGLRIDFVDNQWDGFSGLTLGAGYRLEGLSIDYAFLPMGELGTSNLISLSYHFQAVNLETAKDAGSAVQAPATKPLPVKIASTVQPPSTPTATPTSEPADTHGTPQTVSTGSATDGPPALPFGAAISESTTPTGTGEASGMDNHFALPPGTQDRGRELEKEGRLIEAINVYIQAIQGDQKNLLAWWGLGNVYYRLGRRDYAAQCFNEVLEIKPDAADLKAWLGRYGAPTTAVSPASSMSVSALSMTAPDDVDEEDSLDIRFELTPDITEQGKKLEQEGKYIEAIHLYAQAVQTDQKDLLAWWGLGNIYYRLGRKDYAVPCFEWVLNLRPDAKRLGAWLEKYKAGPPTPNR